MSDRLREPKVINPVWKCTIIKKKNTFSAGMIKKREKENDLVVKAAGSEQSFLFLIKDNNLAFD